jgi:Pyridine nucleotide-disulphide oxidoreductase
MALRPPEFYQDQSIELQLNTEVTDIDTKARHATLADGRRVPFDKLLLATGAEPARLDIPGADQVHLLRSLSDSRAIIAKAQSARCAVVLGASFIGLEVAASLRARELEVHVVAPDRRPMERILGREFSDFIRGLHEEHGVVFHVEETATAIDGRNVKLKSGTTLSADFVVAGIGVRPRTQLAERAGLKIDRGVAVNAYLETTRREFLPPATLRGGWILTRARISGLNIGSLLNAKARLQRETSSDSKYDFPTSRSSGASITTCRSITSVTPRNGTRSKSRATSRGAIASCAIAGTAGCWRLPRSFAISRTSRRKRRWSAVQPVPLKPGLDSSQVRIFRAVV